MFDITPIIEALIGLAASIVTAVVIPYIKSRTTAQKWQEITAWVSIAVTAAEQLYKGSGRGAEKKEYVLSWLRARGIAVDTAEVDALVESAVHGLPGSGT